MQTKKVSTKNPGELSLAGRKIESGIDVLERARIRMALKRYGERFLKKIYTERERKSFLEEKEIYFSIGFSMKEAFWKTLPADIQGKTYFDDIEILWDGNKLEIFLSGKKVKNAYLSYAFNKKNVLTTVIRYL
ncbi:MAG TPA: 4'-phosphopantetheinyl transferase superfamily protein [bacterium]|nr:4'-phosphopantetheinyl transferase superfamily protein [bacterium]HOL35603.1 4'-phosphopantetheinyl transferase superfamily protein [bacterium]HPP08819.1 4'-phosphopantetheinyl transferase superfamily protein [bacterium]